MNSRLKIISSPFANEFQRELNNFLAGLESGGSQYDISFKESGNAHCAYVLVDTAHGGGGDKMCIRDCEHFVRSCREYTRNHLSASKGWGSAYCTLKGERIGHGAKCCDEYYAKKGISLPPNSS